MLSQISENPHETVLERVSQNTALLARVESCKVKHFGHICGTRVWKTSRWGAPMPDLRRQDDQQGNDGSSKSLLELVRLAEDRAVYDVSFTEVSN